MKKKGIKRLIASIIALMLSLSMLIGTTFAWFTDSSMSNNNIIISGNLDVNAYWMEGNQDPTVEENWIEFDGSAIFNYSNWEPGYVEAKHVKISNEGSLAFKYKLDIVANGPVSALANVIDVYYLNQAQAVTRNTITNATKVGTLAELIADPDGAAYGILLPKGTTPNAQNEVVESVAVTIAFKMQESAGNEYFNMSIGSNFDIAISAIQYSFESDSFGSDFDAVAQYPTSIDNWDGTVDLTWFDPNSNEQFIKSAEEFAGLAQLVDGIPLEDAVAYGFTTEEQAIDEDGNVPTSWKTSMEGQTIKLESNIDLLIKDENGEAICFDPIGSYRFDNSFKGIFDGQGHTIKNLTQNTWALDNGYYYNDCGLGLFGAIEGVEDEDGNIVMAGVKNLIIDGADISGESALCGTVAAVAHNAIFENITIKNANVADYQYYAGGMVGWASGEQIFINCKIDESTNVAAQWGDFDNSIGGVIGGASTSAQILLKDCVVACRIDAYNDVTSSYQWYAYRRAGMLIGNSGATQGVEYVDENGETKTRTCAAAPQLTCENVTVIYGDWANYTYCEFAGTSWPYVRVQAGVSNGAYSNPRYGHPTDANGNAVVDDNHIHNEGEDHFELLVFDQLYGGGQGVYGTATHEGVTINYNNR